MGFGPGESCRGIHLPRLGSSLLVGSEFQYVTSPDIEGHLHTSRTWYLVCRIHTAY